MAEVEISVLTEQCQDRRLSSEKIVKSVIGAWEAESCRGVENCQKTRRFPLVGCTLFWADVCFWQITRNAGE